MPWRRRIGLLALLIALAAAVVYGFLPKPVSVDVAKVTRGPFKVTIAQEGKTRLADSYTVSAPVAGYVRRVQLAVGDRVVKGQALAELEPLRPVPLDARSRADAEARVAAARAALSAAEENARAAAASADYAAARFDRTKRLYESGSAAGDDFDKAEAETRQAKAQLQSARFAVDVARFEVEEALTALRYAGGEDAGHALRIVTVRAPVKGRVLCIDRESEGVVNAGEALVRIGDPRALEVEIDVLSSDAVNVRPGMPVLFEHWGGDVPLQGRVRVVEPAGFTKVSALGVEEQRVFVIADITSPRKKWERLGDGYRVEAHLVLWQAEDVLQVPASALFRRDSEWALFVVEHNRAQLRRVQVGRRSGLAAEVVSGLAEGETVITHPGREVEDGRRVRVREESSLE